MLELGERSTDLQGGGVECARGGVECARGGVECARGGVECARGGVECATSADCYFLPPSTGAAELCHKLELEGGKGRVAGDCQPGQLLFNSSLSLS